MTGRKLLGADVLPFAMMADLTAGLKPGSGANGAGADFSRVPGDEFQKFVERFQGVAGSSAAQVAAGPEGRVLVQSEAGRFLLREADLEALRFEIADPEVSEAGGAEALPLFAAAGSVPVAAHLGEAWLVNSGQAGHGEHPGLEGFAGRVSGVPSGPLAPAVPQEAVPPGGALPVSGASGQPVGAAGGLAGQSASTPQEDFARDGAGGGQIKPDVVTGNAAEAVVSAARAQEAVRPFEGGRGLEVATPVGEQAGQADVPILKEAGKGFAAENTVAQPQGRKWQAGLPQELRAQVQPQVQVVRPGAGQPVLGQEVDVPGVAGGQKVQAATALPDVAGPAAGGQGAQLPLPPATGPKGVQQAASASEPQVAVFARSGGERGQGAGKPVLEGLAVAGRKGSSATAVPVASGNVQKLSVEAPGSIFAAAAPVVPAAATGPVAGLPVGVTQRAGEGIAPAVSKDLLGSPADLSEFEVADPDLEGDLETLRPFGELRSEGGKAGLRDGASPLAGQGLKQASAPKLSEGLSAQSVFKPDTTQGVSDDVILDQSGSLAALETDLAGDADFAATLRGGDLQGAARTEALQTPNQVQSSHVATQVAVEMVRNLKNAQTRFQMRFDPPELGRVDVNMKVAADGTVQAHLIVERPETLDMFLRDQRGLERALEAAGLSTNSNDLQFSLKQGPGQQFASGDQGGQQHGGSGQSGAADDAAASDGTGSDPADGQLVRMRLAEQRGGLDVRI